MNRAILTLDLHGKTLFQARVALNAALRRASGVYRIRVIHGFHAGAALRELVRGEYAAHPLILRAQPLGEGATDLILREL